MCFNKKSVRVVHHIQSKQLKDDISNTDIEIIKIPCKTLYYAVYDTSGVSISRQESVVGRQESVVGRQNSLISRQGSVVGRQNSLISRQGSVVGRQNSLISRQGSVVGRQNSLISRQESVVGRQNSLISRQGSVVNIGQIKTYIIDKPNWSGHYNRCSKSRRKSRYMYYEGK